LWEGTKDALCAIPNRWQRAAAEMDHPEATSPPAQTPDARATPNPRPRLSHNPSNLCQRRRSFKLD